MIFHLRNIYRIILTEGLCRKSIAFDVRFIQSMDPIVDPSGRKLNSIHIDLYVGSQPLSKAILQGFHKFCRNCRNYCSFLDSRMTRSKFPDEGPQILDATVRNVVAPGLCTLVISLSIAVGQWKESNLYMKNVKSMLCRQTVYDYCQNHRKRIITQ